MRLDPVLRRASVVALVALVAPALAVGGCGGEDPEQEVRSTVEDFGAAFAQRDVQRLCDELLSRTLVERVRAAGLPCEVALQQALGSVRRPTLAIDSVEVNGDRALAKVRTGAEGQAPSSDTLQLVREQDRWKVASLARPQPQPPPPAGP